MIIKIINDIPYVFLNPKELAFVPCIPDGISTDNGSFFFYCKLDDPSKANMFLISVCPLIQTNGKECDVLSMVVKYTHYLQQYMLQQYKLEREDRKKIKEEMELAKNIINSYFEKNTIVISNLDMEELITAQLTMLKLSNPIIYLQQILGKERMKGSDIADSLFFTLLILPLTLGIGIGLGAGLAFNHPILSFILVIALPLLMYWRSSKTNGESTATGVSGNEEIETETEEKNEEDENEN